MAGAVMLWVCAPPSDQLENPYDVPPTVCGVGALIEFAEPMMTVRVNGAGSEEPSTTSWSPVGLLWKVRLTVFGCSITLVEEVAPPESVAVSTSSRNDG